MPISNNSKNYKKIYEKIKIIVYKNIIFWFFNKFLSNLKITTSRVQEISGTKIIIIWRPTV
jgi:hypothetical protein